MLNSVNMRLYDSNLLVPLSIPHYTLGGRQLRFTTCREVSGPFSEHGQIDRPLSLAGGSSEVIINRLILMKLSKSCFMGARIRLLSVLHVMREGVVHVCCSWENGCQA